LIERGAMQRTTGTTKLNELSSRSHAVFIIIVEKSTVPSEDPNANGEEMEQFRGVAPGNITPDMQYPRATSCSGGAREMNICA
jgi:hypothetical protein